MPSNYPFDRRCPCDCPAPEYGYDEGYTHCPYCGADLIDEDAKSVWLNEDEREA